jgi:hypothetical protein
MRVVIHRVFVEVLTKMLSGKRLIHHTFREYGDQAVMRWLKPSKGAHHWAEPRLFWGLSWHRSWRVWGKNEVINLTWQFHSYGETRTLERLRWTLAPLVFPKTSWIMPVSTLTGSRTFFLGEAEHNNFQFSTSTALDEIQSTILHQHVVMFRMWLTQHSNNWRIRSFGEST